MEHLTLERCEARRRHIGIDVVGVEGTTLELMLLRRSTTLRRFTTHPDGTPIPTHSAMTKDVEMLRTAKVICVHGLSRKSGRPAHDIPHYLLDAGYQVVGVNPFVEDIGSMRCYPKIEDVQEHIDILNVFRPSEKTDGIIDEAIERRGKRGDISCIWLQSGITSQFGKTKCSEAGIVYVDNSCIYVVHSITKGIPL